jgi:hypothetical protein
VEYIGPPDVHDGRVLSVLEHESTTLVMVELYGGDRAEFAFEGAEVCSKNPDGMVLYALVEFQPRADPRCFAFVNTEDDDPRSLRITARRLRWRRHGSPTWQEL